jgi:dTDP-4-dehydrorhamnose reductase
MTRYLVTGGKGRLGSAITALLKAKPSHIVHSIDIDDLDITDFSAIRQHMTEHLPQVVIHAAAWTDVDGCAKDPERAIVANGFGAGNVAVAAAEVGACMVYISSNEVFDGYKTDRNYLEHDVPNPINPYGYSKYVGEQEVARLNPRHMIVRTSWLFAHGGKNFTQAIINAASAGKSLHVVTDEVANPTYTDDLAVAVVQLAATVRYGTYHLVNEGAVPRWDFARYILDRTGYADTPIGRITRKDWPRPSLPPAYCGLDNIAAKHLGITLRPWQAAVDAFLSKEGLLVNAD